MQRYGPNYDFDFRGAHSRYVPRGEAGPHGGRYDREYGARRAMRPNRVTARYNLDYVRPQGDRRPVNYAPYGGPEHERVGSMRYGYGPYLTTGGTRTWRGGGLPIGWENAGRYGRDYQGPYR